MIISLFPNNVITVTGNAGTFAFESKKGIMCIPVYGRSNNITFEKQNKQGFYNVYDAQLRRDWNIW